MAFRYAMPQGIVAQRFAQIAAPRWNLGVTEGGGKPAARRKQTALRPIELAGHDAWNGWQAAQVRTLGECRQEGCGIGVVRIGKEAAHRLLFDFLPGILDGDPL